MTASRLFDLLCIGVGPEQLPGIEVALGMGFSVLALDGDPAAPGLKAATLGMAVDLKDTEAVVAVAREAGVRAIVPVPLGSILTTTGVVNDALGLRGLSEKAARLCTDKLAMRKALAAAGLQQPACRLASTVQEVKEAAGQIGFPVIVKPRYGSGSRGVRLLTGEAELAGEIASDTGWLAADAQELLVEAAFSGVEHGIDGVVAGREFSLISLRAKDLTPPPHRVAIGYTGPLELALPLQRELVETFQRACEALDIGHSLLHADVMIGADGSIGIIELSARPSGYGLSQVLLPATTGIQPTEQAIRMLTGMEFSFQPTRHRIGILRTLLGWTADISPAEIIKARGLAGVVELSAPSSLPPKAITSGSDAYRMGHAIIVGDTLDDVEATWQEVQNMLGLTKGDHGN